MKFNYYKLITLLGLAVFTVSCGVKDKKVDDNSYIVQGQIENLNVDMKLSYLNSNAPKDTIHVDEEGNFSFKDSISQLTLVQLSPIDYQGDSSFVKKMKDGRVYPAKSSSLYFFASPGAQVEISGSISDFVNAYPSGDKQNDELAAINKIAYPYYNESINKYIESTYAEDSLSEVKLRKEAGSLNEEGVEKRLAYLEENINSAGAIWYMLNMIVGRELTDDQAVSLFEKINADTKKTPYYNDVETRVQGILATKEGAPVPGIKTTATIDGKEFNIESYRGKYVLIDFWGTWCGPCVAEMPEVKEFQEEHKDNLYVLGINYGDTKEKMVVFLEKNGYEWQQVMSSQEDDSDNFAKQFNVQGFPTKFVIDREGKIVKRFLGSSQDAFDLLEELFENEEA